MLVILRLSSVVDVEGAKVVQRIPIVAVDRKAVDALDAFVLSRKVAEGRHGCILVGVRVLEAIEGLATILDRVLC